MIRVPVHWFAKIENNSANYVILGATNNFMQ